MCRMTGVKVFGISWQQSLTPAEWDGRPMRTVDERWHAATRRRVLVVGSASREADTFRRTLSSLDLESTWTRSGADGLQAARGQRFDLSLVDVDLPDMSGLDVVCALRAEDDRNRCVIVSEAVTASVTREAMQCGAIGVLGKPLTSSDVVLACNAAGNLRLAAVVPASPPVSGEPPRSVAERWALFMVRTIHAEHDPKTIESWAKSVGVSRSALCECCRLVRVSPRRARDCARIIRAVHQSGPRWQPEAMLDLADARTLKKLLANAGLPAIASRTPTMEEVLQHQRWIPASNPGLVALRMLLLQEPPHADDGSASSDRPADFPEIPDL
jgi:CheY-like chemotaxis protein